MKYDPAHCVKCGVADSVFAIAATSYPVAFDTGSDNPILDEEWSEIIDPIVYQCDSCGHVFPTGTQIDDVVTKKEITK